MFITDTNRNKPHKYQQGGFKKVQDIYEDIYDEKTGHLVTKKTDANLFYEEIQEAKDSIYLPSILEKYKIDINKKALVEIDTNVVDMTTMPQDMTSMFAFMKNQEMKFDKFPVELKKQFNNSYYEFANQSKTGEAMEKINKYNEDIRTKKGIATESTNISEKEISTNAEPTNVQPSGN